jgi:hypothetical protein
VPLYIDDAALVSAWVACGELERARAHAARTTFLSVEAHAALASGLVEAGRCAEALAYLRGAFEGVRDRTDLLTLIPVLLAITDDPRSAAHAMLGAWERAVASGCP